MAASDLTKRLYCSMAWSNARLLPASADIAYAPSNVQYVASVGLSPAILILSTTFSASRRKGAPSLARTAFANASRKAW